MAAPLPSRRSPLAVSRSATGYVLRDDFLAALVGDPDTLLPLPFTPDAHPDDVVAHLRRLNPHRDVQLATEPGTSHAERGTQNPEP